MALSGHHTGGVPAVVGTLEMCVGCKLLRKTVSPRVLEPHLRFLWKLKMGYEIIDIDNRFFSVRFYSCRDISMCLREGHCVMLLPNGDEVAAKFSA